MKKQKPAKSKSRGEARLDEGVKETFPASDPVAVEPTRTAHELEAQGEAPPAPPSPQKRSPDWLLEKKH